MHTKSDLVNASAANSRQDGAVLRAVLDMRESLSAMVDGEITEQEAVGVLKSLDASAQERQVWAHYQWLGEALRSREKALPPSDARFVAGVMERIHAEAAMSELSEGLQSMPVKPNVARLPEAANDAVFRWKMVAGVATFAAAAALVWQVAVAPSSGPQLAQAPAQASELALAGDPNQQAVLTEHGVVIRDARLEALLAEHRQYGGMSALQTPAGFLRNATYEVPQR